MAAAIFDSGLLDDRVTDEPTGFSVVDPLHPTDTTAASNRLAYTEDFMAFS
jgi:hypothetical protein